jgi:hypothetical protein
MNTTNVQMVSFLLKLALKLGVRIYHNAHIDWLLPNIAAARAYYGKNHYTQPD